jgi:transcription elongation factor Elf1
MSTQEEDKKLKCPKCGGTDGVVRSLDGKAAGHAECRGCRHVAKAAEFKPAK